MILTLHTETTIDSAHCLEGYKGKCKHIHGHTWLIELWFRGPSNYVDEVGILVDFGIVKEIREQLDHKIINEMMPDMNPTAENMTQWIYGYIKEYLCDKHKHGDMIQIKVRVYETAIHKKTYCEGGDW